MNQTASRRSRISVPVLLLATVGTIALTATARAQDAASAGTEGVNSDDIVVTAQRRSERLQDVPISIASHSAADLKAANITSTADLGVVTPGLLIIQNGAFTTPSLRGVGSVAASPSIENPVAFYVDGVYLGSAAGSTLSLNNIANIEVDKGPQGTLFGRNATAGLIQITTRDPEHDLRWSGSLTYGNYKTAGGDIYITGGLTPTIALDLSVAYSHQGDGYGVNIATGSEVNKNEDLSLRSKLLFTPTDRTTIRLIGDYAWTKGSPVYLPAPGTQPLGGAPYTGPRQGANSFFDPYSKSERGGGSLKIEQDIDFATLMSLTAYRKGHTNIIYDSLVPDPALALTIDGTDRNWQVSQEFQLQSPSGNSLVWSTGIFLYANNSRYDPFSGFAPGIFAPFDSTNFSSLVKTRSASVYGQGTAKLAERTRLTVGLRYTTETRKASNHQYFLDSAGNTFFDIFDNNRRTFNKVTWRLSLDHRFSDAMMVYASYNRGFKSGGFNEGSAPMNPFDPETLDAFEVGLKAQAFDRVLQLNAAGFYYDYKKIQTVRYVNTSSEIVNGAGAKLYGLDADITARFDDRLTLSAGGVFMHSEYKDFPSAYRTVPDPSGFGGTLYFVTNDDGTPYNARGNQVALAPNTTISATADYALPVQAGTIRFNASYAYNSGWYAEPDNRLEQKGYSLFNGQISFEPESTPVRVRLWAKNLFNKQYIVSLGSQFFGDYAYYAPPRTYGVTVEKKF